MKSPLPVAESHHCDPSSHGHRASPKVDHHKNNDISDPMKRMDHLKKHKPEPRPPPGEPSSSRPRFASMPQPLPSEFQAQLGIDRTRIFRGPASPPLVDFTRFEDTYRAPRTGNFEGLMASTSSSSSGLKSAFKPNDALLAASSSDSEASPDPAAKRKPDPRLLLSSLSDILGASQEVDEHLDMHELLAAHQLDQLDFEARESAKTALLENSRVVVQGQHSPLVVLGEPLRKSWTYSSTTQVLGGREHELPVLVVHCVEELYRTGIYQSNLFRTLPNRFRLLELINIFDSEDQLPGSAIRSRQRSNTPKVHPKAGFGFNTSLHLESTPDICALLTTYLSSLPEPLLVPPLFRAIWDWCDIEHDEEDQVKQQETYGQRVSPISMVRSYTNPTESAHILIVQLVLHLLPSPNFSLLVYLLAFFSQVALVREENGVGVQDLGRMFGARLFGSGTSSSSTYTKDKGKGKARDAGCDGTGSSNMSSSKGEKMMCWFLRRWGPISDGLFEVVEDAKMGIFRPPVMRKDSLGKDVLSGWLAQADDDNDGSEDGNGSKDDVGDGGEQQSEDLAGVQDVSFAAVSPPSSGAKGRSGASSLSRTLTIPRIRIQASPPQDHSTPKTFQQRKRKSFRTHTHTVGEADETFDITQLNARSLSSSTYPGSPHNRVLDERLMDVSMSALLVDQTLPYHLHSNLRRTFSPTQIPAPLRQFCSSDGTSRPERITEPRSDPIHLHFQIIAELEKQLRDRTECLTDSLKDLARCKLELEASRRKEEVRELEKICLQ
ncbi:hypothetical protein CPB84DRAFT_1798280 [Gymnopilus junonius]|uniref:Rho-GAP domain-containing protein n=1 Tax=Gymnopilus junonius TaxID=109634 RepID=A0A9P5TG56_GYMJU|nr:hypothetical protein CPB84DRAFT_1798280 [Gymnopilus junonius]